MYRVHLTDEQHQALQEHAHKPGIASSTRDRLEMVRLSDAGWRIPRIAVHLNQHEQTVRFWIKAFLEGGFAALNNKPRGGATSALTASVLLAVQKEVTTSGRTWNAQQIAAFIALRFGIKRSADQVRRKLRQSPMSYKRTGRHLRHKQKPEEVAARTAELAILEKGGSQAS